MVEWTELKNRVLKLQEEINSKQYHRLAEIERQQQELSRIQKETEGILKQLDDLEQDEKRQGEPLSDTSAFARMYTLGVGDKIVDLRTSSEIIYGLVTFPEVKPKFKFEWDFREDGVCRIALFRCSLGGERSGERLIRSLSIAPDTGFVLPYYEAQQKRYE
jgi:hypothetical protein